MTNPAVRDEDKFNRITVPIFSTKWAIVLCICNILVPGLGTCLAGLSLCCPCSDNPSFGCADCWCSAWLQFGVAALQLLLTPLCLIGWIWSCIWGCAFIGRSNPEWRARQEQAAQMRQHDVMMSLVTEQPTASAGVNSSSFSSPDGSSAGMFSSPGIFSGHRGFGQFADSARHHSRVWQQQQRWWRRAAPGGSGGEYRPLPPDYEEPPPPSYEQVVAESAGDSEAATSG